MNSVEVKELEQEMEMLRRQMIETAERTGSLVDASVVAISQQLDRLVVRMQRMKMDDRPQLT